MEAKALMTMLSDTELQEQGAIPAPKPGAFVYRLSDGRKITYTATIRIEDLSNRKGGGFDKVYRHKDNTFWLRPGEELDVFGVVIRETGIKEAFVGLAELPKAKINAPKPAPAEAPPKA